MITRLTSTVTVAAVALVAILLAAGAALPAREASAACLPEGVTAQSFNAPPVVTLTPSSGSVGTTVAVKGTGFQANQLVEVVFRSPGDPIVASGQSDASGAISLSFQVPQVLAGRYDVLVRQSPLNCYHTTLQFIVVITGATPTPTITPTPTPRPPTPTQTPVPPIIIPPIVIAPITPAPPVTGDVDSGGDSVGGFDPGVVGLGIGILLLGGALALAAQQRRRS
jgi:hypothetical protein